MLLLLLIGSNECNVCCIILLGAWLAAMGLAEVQTLQMLTTGFPPMAFVRDGKLQGFCVDIVEATAAHYGLSLVTRNVRDFADLGLDVINPWIRYS